MGSGHWTPDGGNGQRPPGHSHIDPAGGKGGIVPQDILGDTTRDNLRVHHSQHSEALVRRTLLTVSALAALLYLGYTAVIRANHEATMLDREAAAVRILKEAGLFEPDCVTRGDCRRSKRAGAQSGSK